MAMVCERVPQRCYDRGVSEPPVPDQEESPVPSMPVGVRLWFIWAFVLLAITGILLPRIIEFVDFS